MSCPLPPTPGKLIISVLTAERDLLPPVAEALTDRFGPLDIVGPWWPFQFTSYYEKELGAPLMRRMLSFKPLWAQGALPDIKLETNALETRFAQASRRRVNLDPGLLMAERLVLATGKNFSHRIYLGKKIYADLTLIFQRGRFQTLPWTYPDYGEEKMLAYLQGVRNKYGRDLSPRPIPAT
ncbi:MAG: DUF4416 family protein [Desulfobacterales bacterium]|jgi:hypothetical protein